MKRAIVAVLAVAAVALALPVGAGAARPKTAPPHAWDAAERDRDGDVRIVVLRREGGAPGRSASRLAGKPPAQVKRSYRHIAGDVLKVQPARVAEVVAELEADPDVVVAAPDARDQRVVGQVVPWGIARINADPASRGTRSGAGVKVAVIDTGVWATPAGAVHPDLAAAYRGGHDFVNDDPFPWDDHGHGTHVAGIVAAADDTAGVVGVAPGVALYALKVLDADGEGFYSDFIAALDWCIEHGIRIVNYSAGGLTDWAPMEEASLRARAAGVTIVAAAGNAGVEALLYPAAYSSTIAVGSTGVDDLVSGFSNFGAEMDLVAPGEAVRSTYLGGGYELMSGTSMATPHVAGAAALLAGRGISDPRLIQEHLQATAADGGAAGPDPLYGHGRIDATAGLAQGVRVITPQRGAVVRSGRAALVSWDPVPGAATYRVLFAAGSTARWREVVAATARTSISWRAPVVGQPLATGRLQVAAYAADGTLLAVATRSGFTVRALRVTAPAAGAQVVGGTRLRVSWEVYGTLRPVASIAVERSYDGGKNWRRLQLLPAAARTWTWSAPTVSAQRQARLRLILLDAAGAAITNAAFSVVVTPAVR